MGICIQPQIENQGLILNTTEPMKCENFNIIEKQKKNSVLKIINADKLTGTGFLCLIPYPDKTRQLPTLITCNHVINGNEKEVKLIINDSIEKMFKLENRKMYINNEENKGVTIIEIKMKTILIIMIC